MQTTTNAPSPDRYNSLGEWKPLVYRGDADPITSKASLLSEDDDVRGALLYIMCTQKQVLEYVVRSNLELPSNYVRFGDNLHLWLCPPVGEMQTYGGRNVNVYDGWHDLQSDDPVEIEEVLRNIGRTMNRMAFTFGATVDWRPKYKMTCHTGAAMTPVVSDMPILRALLSASQDSKEDEILDAAIDWYNRGSTSRNPFTAFLCYYIALESVAIAVTEGDADFGLGYSSGNKQQLQEERITCITSLYDSLFSDDPVRFVQKAYFDCVLSLTKRVRTVIELAFGSGHPYLAALTEKHDGVSLSDIRSKLAHGRLTLVSKEDKHTVRKRLHEIAHISKEFLMQ